MERGEKKSSEMDEDEDLEERRTEPAGTSDEDRSEPGKGGAGRAPGAGGNANPASNPGSRKDSGSSGQQGRGQNR